MNSIGRLVQILLGVNEWLGEAGPPPIPADALKKSAELAKKNAAKGSSTPPVSPRKAATPPPLPTAARKSSPPPIPTSREVKAHLASLKKISAAKTIEKGQDDISRNVAANPVIARGISQSGKFKGQVVDVKSTAPQSFGTKKLGITRSFHMHGDPNSDVKQVANAVSKRIAAGESWERAKSHIMQVMEGGGSRASKAARQDSFLKAVTDKPRDKHDMRTTARSRSGVDDLESRKNTAAWLKQRAQRPAPMIGGGRPPAGVTLDPDYKRKMLNRKKFGKVGAKPNPKLPG